MKNALILVAVLGLLFASTAMASDRDAFHITLSVETMDITVTVNSGPAGFTPHLMPMGHVLGGSQLSPGIIWVDASACSSPVDLSAYVANNAAWQLTATPAGDDQYALALQVGAGATTTITDDAGPAGTLFDNNGTSASNAWYPVYITPPATFGGTTLHAADVQVTVVATLHND